MNITAALQFVRGAISRKDLVPALRHFCIRNKQIKSFNGSLGLCSPINCEFTVAPDGAQFLKAIQACGEQVITLGLEESGRLAVMSDNLRVVVDCADIADFPDVKPTGTRINLTNDIREHLQALSPFVATDASRPWACGILLDGEFAYATNNIVLVQAWLGYQFPVRVNLPSVAVEEILRIPEPPLYMLMDEARVSFHYADGRWLLAQLLSAEWPDAATRLDSVVAGKACTVHERFYEAVEQLLPFADELGRVYFHGDCIATTHEPNNAGAQFWLGDGAVPAKGIFNATQLLRLKGLAKDIDFGAYPEPCPFFGDAVRGVICGFRS